jgi:proline dehydrogenase
MPFSILDRSKFSLEPATLARLLASTPLDAAERGAITGEAGELVAETRKSSNRKGIVESFLEEYSLSTREGLALMCLAEAFLRTPDEDTRDMLIAERIASTDWSTHFGRSDSLIVNASTWSLMLTGKLIEPDEQATRDLAGFLRRVAGRIGEPLIRGAVGAAMRMMGEQFVLGRTIGGALQRARKHGYVCSFDMLGEGACTESDAERYEAAYADALRAVGGAARGLAVERGDGVSVKLSALSPRYEARCFERVMRELYPRMLRLTRIAAQAEIHLTIDAEEADRLALSFAILEKLAAEPSLARWTGLGLAIQGYQKRASDVVACASSLARANGRRLMVRLVKGRLLGRGDQTRAGGWTPQLSGFHDQGRDGPFLHRLCGGSPGRGAGDLSAIRHAQCAYTGCRATFGEARGRQSGISAPARYGRSPLRRYTRALWRLSAAMRRSAATKNCCPTSSDGCSRTARIRRSCTRCWTTTSHRRRSPPIRSPASKRGPQRTRTFRRLAISTVRVDATPPEKISRSTPNVRLWSTQSCAPAPACEKPADPRRRGGARRRRASAFRARCIGAPDRKLAHRQTGARRPRLHFGQGRAASMGGTRWLWAC